MPRSSIPPPLGRGAMLFLAAVMSACTLGVDIKGLPGNPGSGGDGGGSASVSVGATASVSVGTSSSVSAGSGGAGAGGGAATMYGLGATDLVSAGGLSKSPNFKLVFTLGQPSIQQDSVSSPAFRIRGGLEGANGSTP